MSGHRRIPRQSVEVSAARMIGLLALVIGQADAHRNRGEAAAEAIERALREHEETMQLAHSLDVALEPACRTVWRIMTGEGDPDPSVAVGCEMFRDTLRRLGHHDAVRREMTLALEHRREDHAALMNVMCWARTGSVPAMHGLLEAFHAYASLVHETTGTRPAVRDLVDALFVMARTRKAPQPSAERSTAVVGGEGDAAVPPGADDRARKEVGHAQ